MAIFIPIFFYFDVSDGTLKFYRLQKLGVGETKMGVAQSISKVYERYTTPLSNESKYANFEYLIRSQEVKRSNVFAVA